MYSHISSVVLCLMFAHISSYFLTRQRKQQYYDLSKHKPTIQHEIIKSRGNPKHINNINKHSGNAFLLCYVSCPPKERIPYNFIMSIVYMYLI